ncbi:MAG: ABC transporter ATP-binding protein [Saprospiraceae bacterium]|nr:ABC transporter ATP-binding protein [Saprospiraceae bacterium]MCB9307077.1 ABC transporter ATP-binding protein [Lewinellaceae bacterium]MCB9353996.1 ABC transporter ATP-binding protein [Lewinellaceae bacterium]
MIQLDQVNKTFGKQQVLNGIGFECSSAQAVAIVGPNGSGKTTLIKSILGMVVPDSGTIRFQGISIGMDARYRNRIGYMPQIGRYPDHMKVGDLFAMMQDLRKGSGSAIDDELIEAFRLPGLYHKNMRTLSGGTRQKVSAALAFLFSPPVLILDEPTAGLDPLSAEILKDKIRIEKQRNRLFLITSHIMSDLDELATDVIYLSEGRVLFYKTLESLKAETGERRLGRAIAHVMEQLLSNG